MSEILKKISVVLHPQYLKYFIPQDFTISLFSVQTTERITFFGYYINLILKQSQK